MLEIVINSFVYLNKRNPFRSIINHFSYNFKFQLTAIDRLLKVILSRDLSIRWLATVNAGRLIKSEREIKMARDKK